MRFLRMLTNSLIAGALGAAYLTVIVLQLNPQIPLLSGTTWRWFLTLGLSYGLHLAVMFYVVMMVREFFSLDTLSPGWASVRVLAWLAAAAAAVAATLMWLNVTGFGAALSSDAARRMTAGAAATTASAVVLLAIAVAHYSFGRRGSGVGATLFVFAACASLLFPLTARGPGLPIASMNTAGVSNAAVLSSPGPRVVMLLLDGASLDYIWPRAAEGRLPNFGRLLDGGASMYLATVRPTQPDPVWAAVATGMYPSKNGVRSAGAYYARGDDRAVELLPDHCLSHALVHLGFIRSVANTSDAWNATPLWSILSSSGISAGIVRWPLTHPAPRVSGFVVSDMFHQLTGSIAEFDRAGYPSGILSTLQEVAGDWPDALPGEDGPPPVTGAPSATPEAVAMRRDRLYSRVTRRLDASIAPRLLVTRYQGLDTVGHYYMQYADERRLRAVPEEERRRHAQVVDRYYAFIDGEVGGALDRLTPGDLLVVVSGFGMQPLNPVKRALGRLLGDPDFTGTHDRAPDGFLLAYGSAVTAGRHQRGSVVDVTPTMLYFLGLPVARDMDGFARADLFSRAFTAERPIAFIPSYNNR
jgi:predicted AlkP superfamily phosphohydrolase/phosphomutase